jgi:hypothetical protein
VRHEGYNAKTHENDVALLELDKPARAKPIGLAFAELNLLEAPGSLATVTGWGTLRAILNGHDAKTGEIVKLDDPRFFTTELMQVEIPVVAEEECKSAYPGSRMDRRMICAGLPEGGKDSCQGDSGGPLVEKSADGEYRQIGVVSFGRQCAEAHAYGVYARVSAFQDWLQQNTKLPLGADATAKPQPDPPPKLDTPVAPPTSAVTNTAGLAVSFVQGDSIRVGQSIQFRASAAKPGFLVLIDIGPDGKMSQIFPNARSLTTPTGKRPKANFVEAGREVVVPDPKNPYEGYKFTADPPAGEGLLVALLSADSLESVPLPDTPTTMSRDEALDFLTKVTGELGRSIEVIGVGGTTTPSPTPAPVAGKPRDWSFATKTYRIIQ